MRDFRVLSTFSSVGGLDLGLERAGMRVVAQAEVDPWRRRVLAERFPGVPIYDDVRMVRRDDGPPQAGTDRSHSDRDDGGRTTPDDGLRERPDLLCGGFPCQDLSVAGKRRGLAGERSGLFFEFARIADEFRPRWLLVENVPGLLSSADGRDMGVVLATLADLGYGLAWRVLDARFFGVPQRRRRVFIVGHSGGEPEPAVRAVGAGGHGDSAARGCSWQGVASRTGERIAPALVKRYAKGTDSDATDCMIVNALDRQAGGPDDNSAQAGHLVPGAGPMVRRLTPIETERLMSWPDDWTAVDGEDTPDSRRYAACGDGVVSNVAEWIARGILREDAA